MLEHGYDGTTVDAVANAAGVTKRTIYSRIGSKEELLQAVLVNAATPALQPLPMLDPGQDLSTNLMLMGRSINSSLLKPEMQRWLRFAVTELALRPELMGYVHALIEEYVVFVEKLLRFLLLHQPSHVQDMPSAARFFATLVAEPARNLAIFAIPLGTEMEQECYLQSAVDMFIGGCIRPAP